MMKQRMVGNSNVMLAASPIAIAILFLIFSNCFGSDSQPQPSEVLDKAINLDGIPMSRLLIKQNGVIVFSAGSNEPSDKLQTKKKSNLLAFLG